MANKIIHKHSSVITDNKAKLPTSEQLEYGELAVNFADGFETISLKNSDDEIVEFKSNEYYETIINNAVNNAEERLETLEENQVTESTVSNWGFTKNTGTYSKPTGGIPKTDMDGGVQSSLGKADTASQGYKVFEVNVNANTSLTNVTFNTNPYSEISYEYSANKVLPVLNLKSTYLNTILPLVYDGRKFHGHGVYNGNRIIKVVVDSQNSTISVDTYLQSVPSEYITETELNTVVKNATEELNKKVDKETFNELVSGDATSAIESFNEIVAFLEGIEDSENLDGIIAAKQDKLVSGTNIKTINGSSILTNGNINAIPSGGSSGKFLGWDSSGKAKWVNNPNTDTQCTSSIYHYSPSEDGNSKLSANNQEHPKGVVKSILRDDKGHVTGIEIEDLQNIVIDSELSGTSTNPLQNKTIYSHVNQLTELVNDKQDTLVSGTNIKTIWGKDILGSGNLIEGNGCTASGVESHVEGSGTTASGGASHAEGSGTTASGGASHAEGWITKAVGDNAHAEGSGTEANGHASHAEGINTKAENNQAHAEGSGTTASGEASHAEGKNTVSSGNYSHAEGDSTQALAISSHVEGCQTKTESVSRNGVNVYYAHAEGFGTIAAGSNSHTEGYQTKTYANNSHAEGHFSEAHGDGSHAEGYDTIANGIASHAEGYGTVTNNVAEHACGKYNVSNQGDTTADNTIFSVGIGNESGPKNALEVRENGDVYIQKDGSYIKLQGELSNTLKQTDVDSALSETSTNPLQNKIIYSLANQLLAQVNAKQDELVSGTNIKTINGNSILSSGNLNLITPTDVDSELSETSTNPLQNKTIYGLANQLSEQVGSKQDTLVSGTTIKTINGGSVLGSGNINLQPTLVSGTNIKRINGKDILGSGNITISMPNMLNYYTKSEIDSMFGDINKVLESIVNGGNYGYSAAGYSEDDLLNILNEILL